MRNVYLRNNIKTIGNIELIFQDQRGILNNAMQLIIAQSDFQRHYQWLEKRQFVLEGEGTFWGEGWGSNIKHRFFCEAKTDVIILPLLFRAFFLFVISSNSVIKKNLM